MNRQDSMPPPELSTLTLKFPKKSDLVKVQDKDSKLATITRFQDIKEDFNKFLNEDFENINS